MSATETPKSNRSTKLWLIVFMVLSVLLFVYGYLQRLEADKQTAIAITNLELARKLDQEAEIQRKIADKAMEQKLRAEQALMECEKSKK